MAVTMTDSAQRINTSHFMYRFAQEERATLAGVSGSPAKARELLEALFAVLVKRVERQRAERQGDAGGRR
jgi:hypothetical protein